MGKIKKNKKFGQWYPDAWDKGKDPGAVDRCGSKTALGAAQKWAEERGMKVPRKVTSSGDFRTIISNCEAHAQFKRDNPKPSKGPKGPKKSADIKDVLKGQQNAGYVDGEGMTPAEFDLYREERLQTLRGDQEALLQGLRNEAQDLINQTSTKNVQISEDAATERQKYASDAEKEWRKYLGDISKDTALEQARIQGQYSLDLQDIINAGNESVENIRGGYLKDVENIRGGYAESVENIRGGYQKDIAKTNRDAAIFGNFVAGFWN